MNPVRTARLAAFAPDPVVPPRLSFRLALLLSLALGAPGPPPAIAQDLDVASLDHQGQVVGGGGTEPFVSGNGRYVVFLASFLVPEDSTGGQVYLFDRLTGELELVSRTPSGLSSAFGADLDASTGARVVTDDGRWVFFASSATDLVPGANTTGREQLWARDRLLGTTELVGVATDGSEANASISEFAVAPNGPWVVFNSTATNLDPEDTDSSRNTFWRHLTTGITRLACHKLVEDVPVKVGSCVGLSLSCDGQYMTFRTSETGLDENDFDGFPDLYVGHVFSGENELLTRGFDGQPVDVSTHPPASIDCSGDRIALATRGALVVDDDNDWDLYVKHRGTDEIRRVETVGGDEILGGSSVVEISPDGNWVAFHASVDLDVVDTNGWPDVYRFPLADGVPVPDFDLISQNQGQAGNLGVLSSAVANTGAVAFDTIASNLMPQTDWNGVPDVFASGPLPFFADGFESGDTGSWSGP